MDNAVMIDGLLALLLIGGAVLGAVRGLFRSLMGLVTVAVAMIGSLILAGLLTGPVTDMIAPRVEDAAVSAFGERYDAFVKSLPESVENAAGSAAAEAGSRGLTELLDGLDLPEGIRLPDDWKQKLLDPLISAAQSGAAQTKDSAQNLFRQAVSTAVRSLVSGAVHAVLVLVLYIVLLLTLKLLTHTLNHVFDIPVLGTVNRLGGAALGLLESALLAFILVYAASHLGVKAVTESAESAVLLPIFLNHSPIELL